MPPLSRRRISVLSMMCIIALTVKASQHPPAPFPGPCPKFTDIQDTRVSDGFNITKFEGLWYEIAYKDITQPRRVCRCTTSCKRLTRPAPGDSHHLQQQLSDTFSIQCPPSSHTYAESLVFNLTENAGVFLGSWTNLPRASDIVFPDMVVDVQDEEGGERYKWVLEFQCIQDPDDPSRVLFTGINFYSRTNTTRDLQQMEESARKHGLAPYLDGIRPYFVVDHEGCVYEPEEGPPPSTMGETEARTSR